jgi:hypothetical protein
MCSWWGVAYVPESWTGQAAIAAAASPFAMWTVRKTLSDP